jgi:hypothetical protein
LVLFCGPADRVLFSVLNSVAGAVSTTIFAGALMSDNPNHLLWRERTYEVRMAGVPEG